MAQLQLRSQQFFRPLLVVTLLLGVLGISATLQAAGNQLLQRSLKISDSQSGATARYSLSFQPTTLDTIEVVRLQICANDPLIDTPCTPPTGFDARNATLIDQTGDTGFSIAPQSTANVIILSRPPFSSSGGQDTYVFDNIVNPDSEGSYYARVQTFSDSDLNGAANHYGGIAFAINDNFEVTATVPPYLLFCAGVSINGFDCENVVGDYLNFGEFSSRQASLGSTQMLAASNARDGYNVRVTGTTLTSGTNVITSLVGSDISRPGVSQFGLNLRANSSPQGGTDVVGSGTGVPTNGYDQVNFFRFNSGDVIASSNAPDNARKYTATYVVNVSQSQSPGVYVSTLTYIALGSF